MNDPIPADAALAREGRMANGGWPPSEKQTNYVRVLQKRLHLPDALLDTHCIGKYGAAFDGLDKSRVSDLIDEMLGWEAIPAGLQRERGQLDLFDE